ncbi:hypothetical protein KKA08_08095, partial [bacterium]|nr:hypothetical protein [bacterium]
MDAQWDLLATYDMAVTTSVLCLGVEFADGHWYVTDGGVSSGVATDNYINILNPDGSLVNRVLQTTTTGWGYRDLA